MREPALNRGAIYAIPRQAFGARRGQLDPASLCVSRQSLTIALAHD